MRITSTLMALAILSGAGGCEAAPNIPMAKAREIATKSFAGKIESAELEQEKGRWVYSFDIRRAGEANIHETLVDANTGEIVSQTTETPGQQAAEKTVEMAYRVIKNIPVPGDGGWDALTIDAATRRLYISHSTQVDILDIDQGKVVGEIPDTPGVHQIALALDLGRGFTSNGKDGTVTIFDLKTGKTLDRVKVGEKILTPFSTTRPPGGCSRLTANPPMRPRWTARPGKS